MKDVISISINLLGQLELRTVTLLKLLFLVDDFFEGLHSAVSYTNKQKWKVQMLMFK